MLELEDHIELRPCGVGIFLCLLERHTRTLTDRHQIKPREDGFSHFLQILMDMRPVRADIRISVETSSHDSRVRQTLRLGNERNDIHAEAVDSLLAPAGHHVEYLSADRRI